jgi:hypothetical protein
MSWISIKDRLPEYNAAVIVLVNYKIYDYFGNATPSKYLAVAELCTDTTQHDSKDYWWILDDNPGQLPLTCASHWLEVPEYPEDNDVQVD